jgi:hypothetical protein
VKEALVLHKYGCGLVLLIAAAFLETLGCGSSSMSNRMLQAVAVTPSQADAQSFPSGQVQFTATGTFSKPPSPSVVTFQAPYSGSWFSTDPVTLVSTGNGTAIFQCIAGKSGTFTITAVASNGIGGPAATAAMVRGQAKLTCP